MLLNDLDKHELNMLKDQLLKMVKMEVFIKQF